MTFQANLPQQDDLDARLAPIRIHFVSTLGPRRERLARYLASPDFRSPAPDVMRQLQEDAHKVRGVAPTLGFERLGRAAEQVDELLDPWRGAGPTDGVSPELHAAMETFLDEMEVTLGSAA